MNLIEILETNMVFEDGDMGTWVTDVKIKGSNNGEEIFLTVRVLMDTQDINVKLLEYEDSFSAEKDQTNIVPEFNNNISRNLFHWNDFMLQNVGANVQKAAILVAMSLILGDDLLPPVLVN